MSEKIYDWLLRLYPRAFREEYGAAARQLFHDRWNAEHGFLARWLLWWDVLGDLAVSIPREYRRPPSRKPVLGYRLSEEAVDSMPKHSLPAIYLSLVAGFTIGMAGRRPAAAAFDRLPFDRGAAHHSTSRAQGRRPAASAWSRVVSGSGRD
jgi:hypothetical protein